MPVTVRGQQLYTKAEVAAMAPQTKIDNNWERYTLTLKNGYTVRRTVNNCFLMNKHTGLVTGVIDINCAAATSATYGTNANLAILTSATPITYPGYFLYGTTQSAASAAVKAGMRNLNTSITAAGDFYLQGNGCGENLGTVANINTLGDFLEIQTYLGSKYGRVTTKDVTPIYMKEGAFYDLESAELVAGKRWLQYTLPLPSGYTSGSYVIVCKNLWSGEIILNISLHPSSGTAYPSIPLPERFRLIKKDSSTYLNAYMHLRYVDGGLSSASNSSAANHSRYMYIGDNLSFNAGTSTWVTGSYFYQGNPESFKGDRTETVVGLWTPDQPGAAIPSVNNNCFSGQLNQDYVNLATHWVTGYTQRTTMTSFVTTNKRTGMVFAYFDHYVSGTSLPTPLTTGWQADYCPSYRYNTGTSEQTLYVMCNNYVGSVTNTGAPATNEYTANLSLGVPLSNGTVPTNNSWRYGTAGVINPTANNLCCWQGSYLGNSSANVL